MDDHPAPPLSPESASGPRNGDLPAYLGNGLIGVRVRENPLVAGVFSSAAWPAPTRSAGSRPPPQRPIACPGNRRGLDERNSNPF